MNTNDFDDMLGSDEEQEQTVLSPGAERLLNEDVIPTGAAAQVVSDDDDDDDDDDVAAAADEHPAPEAATVPKAVAVPPPSPPATDNGEGFIPGLPPVTTSTSSIASPVTYPSVTAEEDDGPGDPVVDDGKTKATAPSPTADAGAGVGAGAGAGAGASTGSEAKGSSDACCYGMCSCELAYCNELWKWVTFKKPVPAIGIIVLSVTLFSLYSIAGVSLLRMASVVALLSMAVVPVLHAVNKFKHPAIVLPSIDISDKAFECIGKCVAKCCKAVLAHKKRVLSWEDPKLSTRALAYLWLLYMYNCLIGAPLLLALVFAVFIGPIAYKAARAPVGDLYRTKAKPALVQLDAKLHSISQKLKKVFADKKMRMAGIAGAVVLSLALWWVLKSTLGMWALFKFGATLGSLFTVGQHLLQRVRVPDTSAAKKTE